jgi:ABC-2 type transport system permease protein
MKILMLTKSLFLEYFRNKISFFFNILFPLVLFILFSLVFFSEDTANFAYFSDIDLDIYGKSYNDEEKLLSDRGKYDAVAVIKDNEVIVYKNSNSAMVYVWIDTLVNKVKSFGLKNVVNIKETKLDYIIFSQRENIYIGTFALSIMSIGMFSVVNLFDRYKRVGTLKRLKLLPMSSLSFVFSFSISQFFISFISLVIIRLIGAFLFSISLKVNVFYFSIALVSSVIGMLGIGTLISVLFKKSAANVSQFLYIVFIFFSGIYFPLEFLPKFLKNLSFFIPVKYIVDIFKFSMGMQVIYISKFFIYSFILIVFGLFLLLIGGKILFETEKVGG